MARGRDFKDLVRRGVGCSLRARRSAVSYMAFICDDDRVQAKLPQVFVSNQHVLSLRDLTFLRGMASSRVHILRRASSWLNTSLLVDIIALLARCLEEELQTHHIILSMDAHKVHLGPAVARACARAGFHLMYIPASMTGWLQPLDLVVFRKFKAWVCHEVERQKLASADGRLANYEVVATYIRGAEAVVAGQCWRRAFELAGLGGQSNVSQRLKRRLQWEEVPTIPNTLPELCDLQAVYPRRYNIPIDEIFDLVLAPSRPPPLVLPAAARLPPARLPRISPSVAFHE